ncbi:MAG: GNAT family N-acetyltransferase [Desulfobacter sp.]|nr:MAG: GNAT family N-acetyltransferase [Desulfobacter sp.]
MFDYAWNGFKMSSSIRPMGPGDMGWIISQHGLVYSNEFNFDLSFEVDIAGKAVSLCKKKDPFTRIWIKEVDGEKAGSIAISKLGEGLAFINFLMVLNRYRGRGIARQLMAFALNYAEGNGFERVRLETYSCLKAARRIYSGLGFQMSDPIRKLNKYGQRFDQEFWELALQDRKA